MSLVVKLLPFFSYLMEVLLIYPWFVWFGKFVKWSNPAPHMNFITYVIIGIYIAIIARLADSRQWTLKQSISVILTGAVSLWLILFRWSLGNGYNLLDVGWFSYLNDNMAPAAIALLSGPLFIWRGMAANNHNTTLEDIYGRFSGGLVAVVILMIVYSFSRLQSSNIWSEVGIYGFSYFAGGLIILTAVNLENLKQMFSSNNEAATSFRRRWASLLVILILFIIVFAVGIASIYPSNLSGVLLNALSTAAYWLLLIISSIIIYPIYYMIIGIRYVIQWLIWLHHLRTKTRDTKDY